MGRRTHYRVEFDSKYEIFQFGAGGSGEVDVGITLRRIVTSVAYSNISNPLPYLALAVGMVGVSFASILVKNLPGVPAVIISTYRLGLTALLLAPVALTRGSEDLRKMRARDWALSALAGVFLAGHFVSWIASLKYTSVASSVVLVTLGPVFVLAGGYFLYGERTTRAGLAGVAVALAGAGVIGASDLSGGLGALQGDVLAFTGAVLVAGYLLIGRSVRQRISVIPYTFILYGACTAVLVVFSLLFGQPLYPYSARELLIFLGLAVIPTIFGHTMFNYALGYVKTSIVSMSTLGEPVGATVLAYAFLGEKVSPLQGAGGVMILVGLYLFLRFSRKD